MEYNKAEHQLFIEFKKAYDSVRSEVLYNILIQFGVSMKLVRLITMCLNETLRNTLYINCWCTGCNPSVDPVVNLCLIFE
jgi:hypothetical protein